MKKMYPALFLILLVSIGYLIYDKVTTKPSVMPQEQKQVSTDTASSSPVNKESHDCLLAAEIFFEQKRAKDIDLYSATWKDYYQESTGMCFVQINGIIYNVKNGDRYRLEGSTFTKVST